MAFRWLAVVIVTAFGLAWSSHAKAQQPIDSTDPSLPRSTAPDVEAFIPLPSDLTAPPAESSVSAAWRPFVGAFAGAFGDTLRAAMIVEKIISEDAATVVYSVGDNQLQGIFGGWVRREAKLSNGRMVVEMGSSSLTVTPLSDGALDVVYKLRSGYEAAAYFRRIPDQNLRDPLIVTDPLLAGEILRIPHPTARDREGRPVELHTRLFKPEGRGPFPLAVFHHGSDIGQGALRTYSNYTIARWLTAKGYAVLVPMRRGRGTSTGMSLEGRYRHNSTGDIIDASDSVASGIEDIEAVMAFAATHADFRPGPVLLVGQSRGGFLSVVYAGKHPDRVSGVINFVGGWLGGGPKNEAHNTGFFKDAGAGSKDRVPQFWLYAERDSFYGEPHTRGNHAAFEAAGGKAIFHFVRGVPGNGHYVQNFPNTWRAEADAFLGSLTR